MIFNIIILIIFIIILLYVINNSYNKIVLENFIPHNKPERLIIENCKKNFAKDVNHLGNKEEFCYNHGFVTNPSLLAGICGNNKKPLHIIKDKENIYYGCIGTRDKKINWNLHDRKFTKYELTPYLSNSLTIKNINSSNLIMFLTADDKATINANTFVGENCIINSKALIEHDCIIGNHCHISTNATINGEVKIESECFIGSNVTTKNNITIKKNSFIKAGSLVK